MKTFVQQRILKLLSILMVLLVAVAITSCSKDKDNENRGEAKVMVVNAVEGSAEQNLYLDNSKLNSSAVAYGESTSYITTDAGTRKAEFRSAGSATVNASFDLSLQANKNYTVYLAGTTSAYTYLTTEDDLTLPPAGKAKIRVVHLAPAATTGIDVGILGGDKIITDLGFKTVSNYITVNANSKFVLFPAGLAIPLLTLPNEVESGKIYTIYVTGATEASITYRVIIRS